MVICQESTVQNIQETKCHLIKLDGPTEVVSEYSNTRPNVEINANSLAYVIYTSGSTGTPKGAMNEHGSVVQLVEKIFEAVYFRYGSDLNLSLVAPYIFDASILPVFASTLLGYKLIIAPEDARFDGKKLSDYYHTFDIDIADVTPAHLRLLLQSATSKQLPKHFIIGGEALSTSLLSDFHNKFNVNEYIISNIYGVAECCVDSTGFDIRSNDKIEYSFVPIGKPLLNDRIYILNDSNQIQPIGTTGEIGIGGTMVGRGYLNLEKHSSEKFILNPFLPEERIFKTGDLGYFLPDGNLQYTGRKDNQVNLNGYRIELGEIEVNLLAFRNSNFIGIKDVLVLVQKDKNDIELLCAYFVAEQTLSHDELRSHLLKFLPSYMIPNYFNQMDQLPLTNNGKMDKSSLPIPEIDLLKLESNYVAPNSEIEKRVADIWADVLSLDKVGIQDNFLELGGNSFKAVRIIIRINDVLDLDVPLNKIFETPTIFSFCKFIEFTISEKLKKISDESV